MDLQRTVRGTVSQGTAPERSGRGQFVHEVLGAGKYLHSSLLLGKRLLLITKNSYLTMILELSYVWKDAQIWDY